jgi:signal peptidase I
VAATLGAVGILLAAAVAFRPHLVRVPAQSMAPTIQSGALILVRTTIDAVDRGDVVAFHDPAKPNISRIYRVIVLPGERFAIVDGVVHVNGTALDEPYVAKVNRLSENYGPYQLPANQYFVLGDNRRDALDSRYIGAIDRRLIWGKWLRW